MIRKLIQADDARVMPYLRRESSLNLFIIGDLENYGYDSEFQTLWGEFDAQGQPKAVLLRYFDSLVFYADSADFDLAGFLAIVRGLPAVRVMSGKKELMDLFAPHLQLKKARNTYFAELTSLTCPTGTGGERVRRAGLDDLERLVELQQTIREFADIPTNMESLRKTVESGSGRFYFVADGPNIVASASTTAENSLSAMVVGVCTHPDYRRQGLATLCTTRLCQDILAEGKRLCLFYNNPEAGKIYKRMGFLDIGLWTMLIPQN